MKEIYSIGHSTKPWIEFYNEIKSVDFEFLVDIRSIPYSRWNPQYNKNRIQEQLGDKYIFMGSTLWGLDEDISFERFTYWVDKLSALAKDYKVVFFCSEKCHTKCHRFYKLTPELEIRGLKVIHL